MMRKKVNPSELDVLLNDPRWAPLSGWHDDHRHELPNGNYRPAMMQNRSEFLEFVRVLQGNHQDRSALQLGLGNCDASHHVFQLLFEHVVTIDLAACLVGPHHLPGLNTHSPEALELARQHAPYDLIFIDAGHSYEDARLDYEVYGPLVATGGIIAFHDALSRPGYPEVEVYRLLETLSGVNTIGTEVGIAWIRKSS